MNFVKKKIKRKTNEKNVGDTILQVMAIVWWSKYSKKKKKILENKFVFFIEKRKGLMKKNKNFTKMKEAAS